MHAQEKGCMPMPIQISLDLLAVILLPVALLCTSWHWFWFEGWIFGLWLVALNYTMFLYMYFEDLNCSWKGTENPEAPVRNDGSSCTFLKWVLCSVSSCPCILKYGWSHFPVYIDAMGFMFLLASFYLFLKSYMENILLSIGTGTIGKGSKSNFQRILWMDKTPSPLPWRYFDVFRRPPLLGSPYGFIEC